MSVGRIAEFDTWKAGYGGATVSIYEAGTTTLASVWLDEAMTSAAANPQTLDSVTLSDIVYGKFHAPVYINQAYTLDIASLDQTGVIRPPLTTLSGEDASAATVLPTGGATSNTVASLLGREFYVEDTAALTTSAATNVATITTAMGRASAAGGGIVYLPDNTAIVITQLTIPAGVILTGRGRSGNPTILQSQTAAEVITLEAGAGLMNLVLDGVNNVAGGIGVYSKAVDETLLQNVLVKRFETGIHQKGGSKADWSELYIDSCGTGAKLHGDLDVSGGTDWKNNQWNGGGVSNCTVIGIDLSYIDKTVDSNDFRKIGFENNTGTALNINGARRTSMPGCWFSGNTVNFNIQDDTLTTVVDNTVVGFTLSGGSINGGTATFDGTCQAVLLDKMDLQGVGFTLSNMTNNVVFRDCVQDSAVTISGQGAHIVSQRSEDSDHPTSTATTTNGTALTAWIIGLDPGEKVWLEAKVVGVRRDGTDYGLYHITRAAHRPGSQLAYKTQTVNYTVGAVLTGATSGATARIIGDTDAGATGTLVLKNIVGEFIDNEIITDSSGGSATANGVLVPQNAALLGSTTAVSAAVESVAGYGADFGVSAGNVEVDVTGAASTIIDWNVSVQVTRGY